MCISYGDEGTSNADLLDQYGFVDASPAMLAPDQVNIRVGVGARVRVGVRVSSPAMLAPDQEPLRS